MVNLFYKKQNKKGQAAIEFLMTYGWMLLVVLIVGALIFSFVDFGQLLPNTLDLNNNLRGEPAQTQARAVDDKLLITFTYNGNDRISIDGTDYNTTFINDPVIGGCGVEWIKNVDTDTATASPSPGSFSISSGSVTTPSITFLRGQQGLMQFNCNGTMTPSGTDTSSGLIENDVFDGNIRITAVNARTSVPVRSEGNIRVSISS
jgi:hypothetical protein